MQKNEADVFSYYAKRFSNHTFLVHRKGTFTYKEFARLIDKCQHYFQPKKFAAGSVLCIAGNNTPEYLATVFACFRAGYTITSINPNLTSHEIIERVKYVNASALLVQQNIFSKEILHDISEQNISCYFFDEAVEVPEQSLSPAVNTFNPTAFIQFTGGTSGAFKAAVISHENIFNNAIQMLTHYGNRLAFQKEVVLVTIPFYHTFSLVFNVFSMMRIGGTCILIENVRNLEEVLQAAAKHQPTIMVAVNTMYKRMMQHPEFSGNDFRSLKICIGGGEKVQSETKSQWKGKTEKEIYEAYGLTETTAMLTCNPLDERNTIDSVGIPLPGTMIRILDEQLNEITPVRTSGNIWVKGPQVSAGYFNNETVNRELYHEGWFNTGDIGEWDENNFLKILDRSKDLIIVSGLKVYPAEVDAAIMEVPGIIDAAALGIKDEHTGEKIVAYIVTNTELSDDLLMAYCKTKLAPYKIPKIFTRIDSIPKSSIGKTSRHLLKQKLKL